MGLRDQGGQIWSGHWPRQMDTYRREAGCGSSCTAGHCISAAELGPDELRSAWSIPVEEQGIMGITREKLYEEVWAEPMTKVAARYNVSSSFLARVCKGLNVPRPERGYWAKLAVGKASPKPALPEARPGDELEWSRDGEPRRVARALPKPPEEAAQSARHSRRMRPARHELLVGAREHFQAGRESDSGYLRPTKRRVVDVFVTSTGAYLSIAPLSPLG